MQTKLNQAQLVIGRHYNFLRETYKVRRLGIFGSVVRGEEKINDIDLLVEFSEPIGLFKFMELEGFLSKVLNKKVDLVTKNAIKPIVKEEILSEAVYV